MSETVNNGILFKPNQLIRGVLDVNSCDYKIFNLALQKAQLNTIRSKENQLVEVALTVKEIKDIYRDTSENRVLQVVRTLEKLVKVPIKWKNENNEIIIATLFSSVKIDMDNFDIVVYMDSKVVNVLEEYKEVGYTPINLALTKKANGFYSQRLYELLRSWCFKSKEKEFTIKELKEILAIENIKSYNNFANLRARVIDSAIADIKANMNMEIEYTVKKKVRKVNSIIFKVKDFEPRHYTFEKATITDNTFEKKESIEYITLPKNIEIEELLLKLKNNNIKISSANNLIDKSNKYGYDNLVKAIEILINNNKDEKIKAPAKYLTGILENLKNPKPKEIQTIKSRLSEPNFTQREYDYNKLERQLLGWASDEEYEDE